MNRKYNDLIGDMLKKSDHSDLKGKGKPLSKEYLKGDTLQHFQRIAKDAGFLPPWLRLQKEIAALIQKAERDTEIILINKKIDEYNTLCPPPMQRGIISDMNALEQAKISW